MGTGMTLLCMSSSTEEDLTNELWWLKKKEEDYKFKILQTISFLYDSLPFERKLSQILPV
jgi:hypothetical protein